MHRTGMPEGRFRSRALTGAALGVLSVALAQGCAATKQGATNVRATAAAPGIAVMSLPVMPESTLALTRRALSQVGGTLQAVQWHPSTAVLSTRFTRNRRGAGMREVAIVATVGRIVRDTSAPATLVELRAWALDSMAVRRVMGDPIERPQTQTHRPRPVTLDDTEDWESVEVVIRALAQLGARRVR